jgi:hypothetical protein
MFKKTATIFFILFFINNLTFANEIPIKVKATSKISTSNNSLQEGDKIKLISAKDVYLNSKLYIKKGAPVTGIITSLENNDFTCQEASIYAENFKTKNVNGETVKLNGIVYKKGRNHSYITQYMTDWFQFIRGGEAQILPEKDSFTLYLENNDDL